MKKIKVVPTSDMTYELDEGESVYRFAVKIIKNGRMTERFIELKEYTEEIISDTLSQSKIKGEN